MNQDFKKGDKVVRMGDTYKTIYKGGVYEIADLYSPDGTVQFMIFDANRNQISCDPIYFQKVSTNLNNMSLKEKFATAFKSEPEKTFRKAEITNGDDFLTEDGQNIFLSWLLKKHGEEFKKEVVDKLTKSDKKCNK